MTSKAMKIRAVKLAVLPEGGSQYSEQTTFVEIAGEEYVVLSQAIGDEEHRIEIDPDEWPSIRDAIDVLMANIEAWEVTE